MWRAFFLAIGIYLCILGAECLVVDKFVMAAEKPVAELDPNLAPPAPATLFGATAPSPPTLKKGSSQRNGPRGACSPPAPSLSSIR